MFRLATVLTAATCLTPMTASAIKMSLSGETEFTVDFADVSAYEPTANVASDLNFAVTHDAGGGNEVGGNVDLNLAHSLSQTSTDSSSVVSLDEANIYLKAAIGTITLTTDGTLDDADSYLAVGDEVKGEEDEFAVMYQTATAGGVNGTLVLDIVNGDAAAAINFSDDMLDLSADIEQVGGNLFVDTEFMITYGELVGEFFGAMGADGNDVETEAALKLTYDFGTAEVFAGASTYTELAAGVEFDVQGLTMSFDISGMSAGVDPSDNSILTPTSTLPDTLKFGLGAEFEYSDHLTISADLDTSTVADVNTTTAQMVVTLDF